MSTYDFVLSLPKVKGTIKICITNRQLLTGTSSYTPEVRAQILARLELIAAKNLASAIILREKDLSEEDYADLAQAAAKLCARYNLPLILHNFPAVAASFNPPLPLHLSMEKLRELKKHCAAENLQSNYFPVLGASTHTVAEALEAEALGVSYITASHIFPTACKPDLAPRGLVYLEAASKTVSVPVLALGGIHEPQLAACLEAGAAGVCQMSEYFARDAEL